MYKLAIFLVFFCFGVNYIYAQHIQFDWQNCIKGGKNNTTGATVCPASNGYFVTAMQDRGSHVDIVLIKISLAGDSLWSKYYGGADADWPLGAFPTQDGNFYIVGTSSSDDGDITINPYPNYSNVWVIKIDSAGNKLWDNIYGGSDRDEVFNAIVSLDGGLTILSSTFSTDGDITNFYGGGRDIWLLKLDSNGNKQWDFTMGSNDWDYGYGIQQVSDSSYLISGSFFIGKGGNIDCAYSDTNHTDGLLFQVDKNGILIHQKCYHGSEYDCIRSVIELPDGYLISGNTESPDIASTNIGFHPGYTHNGHPTPDIWLQKTDFEWNIEWEKCYGGSGWEDMYHIFQCSNGDYMMFGTTNSHDGDVSGLHMYDETDQRQDVWMVRLNAEGDIIWQRCIGKMSDERIQTNSVLKIDDANYVLAIEASGCFIDGDFTCNPSEDPYNCPYYAWVSQITDTAASVGIAEQIQHIEVKLYPNPANQFATVEIPVTYDLKNAYAEIIDASGRMRDSFKVNEKQFVINVSGYQKGIYMIRIYDERGIITKKFIVD